MKTAYDELVELRTEIDNLEKKIIESKTRWWRTYRMSTTDAITKYVEWARDNGLSKIPQGRR